MALVAFEGVGKVYPGGMRAVLDLSLLIEDGELMVFVGPSGCGKSTALRMVAGLEEITEGEIRIGERVVNALEPRKRDVAMVFQNYALYPHMTVFDNIAFPLRSRRLPKAEMCERVRAVAVSLGLEEVLKRKPRTLSGGQRQRVAMGRAIVRQPQLFLMDEPLSNLDAKLRVQMRAEITNLQQALGVTTIYVTHDQIEAMTMGHRIAVMRKGVLQQVGDPQAIYDKPRNLFVATFIGSPAMNLCRARIDLDAKGLICRVGEQKLGLPAAVMAQRPRLAAYRGRELALGIRPEYLADATLAVSDGARLRARVSLVEALGFERLVHFELPAEPVLTDEVLEVARDTDAAVLQSLQRESGTVPFVARYDRRARVEQGTNTEISVATEHLDFFDLDTGDAIY